MKTIALVGCGRISERHLQVLHQIPELKLVGVCDLQPERARTVGEAWQVPAYTDPL
jgi:predicted dehydrogenase